MIRFALIAFISAAGMGAAQAEEPQDVPDYGLFQTEVEGVTVTRGRSLDEPRVFPSEERKPPRTTMSLKQNFRGSVFGNHRVAREGTIVYREQLLPIRQRDDE